MKKNKLFILAFAACAALLSACSTELGTTDNPNHAGAGEAIVSVSLQFPQADKPAGYADAEPAVPTLDAEKEIKSIAFITFVKGQTGIFLSTNPPLSENGFTDPLTPVDGKVGEYTAKFKILASDFSDKETIVAVANFAEHGLTFSPDLTLDDLKKKLSDKLLDEADKNFIAYPLLMAVVKDELEITEGQEFKCDFEMTRVMARVDVVNKAYVEGATEDGFVLTSARLISAPTEGTMIAGQTVTTPTYLDLKEETTVTDIAAVTGENPTPARQELASMYVYENSNKDKDEVDATKLSATATYVEVKGTYKGTTYTNRIPFKTIKKIENNVNVGGEVVPIVRNTRYLVQILPSESTTDPNFELAVKDWDDGEDLDVQVDFKVPVLEGLDQIPPNPSGATWDAATKTLNITNATTPVNISFMVRGFQDTDFTVEKEYDENVAPLAKAILVDPGTLTGYADAPVGEAPLVRTYKVTIPKYTEECPSLTKLIVFNASYPDAKTEITVKYAPLFTGGFIKNDEAIASDNDKILIDLKGLSNGSTGTVSFFASSDSEVTITPSENKGYTTDFYTFETVDVTDKDLTYYPKYGPCKRVNVAYKAISDNPEFATISVKDASDATRKVLLSHFRKPITIMKLPTNNNVLAEGSHKLYLAVNNGEHGSITYTVFEKEGSVTTLSPSVTYATNSTSPAWANGSTTASETLSDFGVVKQTVTLALPAAIKNPAAVTAYKIGLVDETPLELIPVYPSAYNTANGTSGPITAADKAFRPVLVKTVWWAPINIGQTKISTINNPSTEGGNLFQWGRKRALTWASTTTVGPLAPTAPAVTQDLFITAPNSPYDWRNLQDNTLWNSGTDVAPIKVVANDPCPAGWRVPSKDEWAKSIVGGGTPAHEWQKATSPGAAQNGLLTVTGEGNAKLYFPASGRRLNDGSVYSQGTVGCCWASAENGTNASAVSFSSATVGAYTSARADGMTVRCVQDL